MCSDPERKFYPQREICYASLEREAANAAYERLHKDRPWHDGTWRRWSAEPSREFPYNFKHGVTIGVAETDLRPDDRFTTRESWGPDQTEDEEG